MKKIIAIISSVALCGLMACEKNAFTELATKVEGKAFVKFVHAASDAPGVNILVNSKKINGATPATATPTVPIPLTYGSTFPSAAWEYSALDAGSAKMQIEVPAATAGGTGTAVLSSDLALEANKYYSVIALGVAPTYEAMMLKDEFPAIADITKCYVRFVNLCQGSPAVSVGVKGATTNIVEATAYKAVSTFVAIDPATQNALEIRNGTTLVSSVTFNNFAASRVLTLYYRGVWQKTGTQLPTFTSYINR